MARKQTLIYVLVITAVTAAVFGWQFDAKLHVSGDNAVYLSLARNMADGVGYTSMGTDGVMHPARHFPPGYSAILAAFMWMGVDSLVFFKVLNGLFLSVSLLLLFFIVKGVTDRPVLAFASVLLAVFSPQTMGFATIAMSEMSYMFFVTAGIYALYRYSGNPAYAGCGAVCSTPAAGNGKRPCFLRDGWFWAAVVMLCGAYYIRSVAMSAIGAAIVFFLFRKEWKQALVFAGGVVALLLPWSLRNAAHGIESRYFGTIMTVNPWRPEQGTISSFGEMVEKMINNFDETVIKGFREILFPFMDFAQGTPSGFISVVSGVAVLVVVLFGAYNMGRLRWMFIFYLLGNIALFMLWHGGNGSRYVTPIAPVLFVSFYTGLYYILTGIGGRLSASEKQPVKGAACWLPLVFLVMVFPVLKPLSAQAEMNGQPYSPAYRNYFSIAEQLNGQAPAGTVVVARKPDLFNYHAGRLIAVNYKYTTDPLDLIQDLLNKNATYVVLEQLGFSSTMLYLFPAIEAYPDLFPVVWHLPQPDTYLLGFDRLAATRLVDKAAQSDDRP